MKLYHKIILFLFISTLVALAFPGTALAQPLKDDKLVLGDTFRLAAGETLNGNLVLFGGAATLEKGSIVNGNVTTLGGAVDGDGLITGNINIIGGSISLGDDAVVKGDVQTLGGAFRKSDKAVVEGKVTSSGANPIQINAPTLPATSQIWLALSPVRTVFGGMAAALFMAALAMVVALFWSDGTKRVAHAMIASPALSSGLGCLTLIVAPALIILLTITIILIPVSLVSILILCITFIFGWIAFGMEIGQRITQAFNVTWQPAANAGLGTLVLTLVVSWASLIPFIGWLFSWLAPLIIVVAGVGGMLLTRFGTQTYPFPTPGGGPTAPTSGQTTASLPPANPLPPTEPPANLSETPVSSPAQTAFPVPNSAVTGMDTTIPDLTPSASVSDAAIPDLNPGGEHPAPPQPAPDEGATPPNQ